jgi:hypothetical protein
VRGAHLGRLPLHQQKHPLARQPLRRAKGYLGGICLIKAPDLDAALAWGRKATLATTLPIEVRPFMGEA